MKKDCYTLKEVAVLCSDTYGAMWHAVQRQELKAYRVAKNAGLRVRRLDLVNYLKKRGLKL